MPRDVSLAVSIKDNFSTPLSKASGALSKLRQDAETMGAKIDALNRKKATVSVETTRARQELKAAEKALDDTKASADRLEQARYKYESLQTELRSITSEAKAAEKQLSSLSDTIQKQENRAGSSGGGGIAESGTSVLSKLGQAGALQMVGDLVSQAAGVYVSSAFGGDAATMLSSVLGMGSSGAAIGSMIAPGIGTAIGAGIGSLAGLASGGMQVFGSRDEYFKSMVQEQYQQYQQEMMDALTGGSTTAASREQSRLAFGTLLGSDAEAASFLGDLQTMAATTPFSQAGLEAIAKNLIANGITDRGEQLEMLTSVGEAGSALGLSEQSMAEVATYLGRMNSTGKTNLEYLIPLMERGIPVVDYLAENLGKSKEEVYEMVSKGLIPGAEAARVIADAMGDSFSGSLEKQAQTYNGLVSTLEDARAQLDAAMGEGFNEARKPALQEEIDYLSGEGGEQMKEMYSLIGEFQASLENEKERAMREAMEAVTETDEYQKAALEGNGAEMGRLLMEAKSQAEKAYMETEGYQTLIESQQSAIQGVRDTMYDSYWSLGYDMGKEFQKGLAQGMQQDANSFLWGLMGNEGEDRYLGQIIGDWFSGKEDGSHASGLRYVPYDGYRAILHEGERVLTAREARQGGLQESGGVTVSVTGNSFTVREEADIDRVAEAIAQKMLEGVRLRV